MRGGFAVHVTESFLRDYKRLSVDLQRLVDECVGDFASDPIPNSRRAHNVTPRGCKPTVFSMDVTPNKSHKLSFHLVGRTAYLRRIGTHKQIDNSP